MDKICRSKQRGKVVSAAHVPRHGALVLECDVIKTELAKSKIMSSPVAYAHFRQVEDSVEICGGHSV